MDTIKGYLKPPLANWYEVQTIEDLVKGVKEQQTKETRMGVVTSTLKVELAALVFCITNIVSTIMRAIEQAYAKGFSGFTATLWKGVKAEAYLVAVAVSFIFIVLFDKAPGHVLGGAPREVRAKPREVGNDAQSLKAEVQRLEAEVQRLNDELDSLRYQLVNSDANLTLRLRAQGDNDLPGKLAELEVQNQLLQERAANSLDRCNQMQATVKGMISEHDHEERTTKKVHAAVGPLREQIDQLTKENAQLLEKIQEMSKLRQIADTAEPLRARILELESEVAGLRTKAEGTRVNPSALAVLMRNLADSGKVTFDVAQIRRLELL